MTDDELLEADDDVEGCRRRSSTSDVTEEEVDEPVDPERKFLPSVAEPVMSMYDPPRPPVAPAGLEEQTEYAGGRRCTSEKQLLLSLAQT
jgi:hypothetical protein